MSLGFRFWLWAVLTGSRLKAYLLEGKRLLAAGQNLLALNTYREVVRQWPNRSEGYYGMSKAYWAMSLRPESAREQQIGESLARLQDDPDDVEARINLARALVDKEMHGWAAAHLDYALKLAPREPEVLKLAANSFSQNRNYTKAADALFELVRQEPLNAEHYEVLTRNLRKAGLTQQAAKQGAIAEALKAVEAEPGNSEVVDRAVRHFLAGGKRSLAITLVDRSLESEPQKSGLHRLKGELLLDERQGKAAIESLMKAVELDPTDIKAHALLSKAYRHENLPAKAEQHGSLVDTIEAAKKSDDPLEADAALVRVLLDSGHLERALEQAEKMAREHPADWRSPYVRGLVLGGQGQQQEALRAFAQSVNLNSMAPEPHLELARLHSEAGEVLEAVGEARKAVNISPRDPEIRRVLAGILRAHGYLDQAAEEEELAEAFEKKVR
jgi:Flp pilus assembly protein TadD